MLLFLGLTVSSSAAQAPTKNDAAQRGIDALNSGDLEGARTIFHEALRHAPDDPQLLLGEGVASALQGRESEAIPLLKRSLQIEPRLEPAAILLGQLLYRQGDLDDAITLYERTLAGASPKAGSILRQRLQVWRTEAALPQNHTAVKNDRFTIMFDGPVQEALATRAAQVLEAAFWRIGKTFGAYPSAPINIVLYTKEQFHDVTGAPEWSAGSFDGQIRVPVAGVTQSLPAFDRVLTHELAHAMLKQIAPPTVPAWLNEGLAMHLDGHDPVLAEHRLAANHLFVPLSVLQQGFGRLNATQAAVAYEESAFATRALLDRIGPAALPVLLQDLGTGQRLEEAVTRFGVEMTAFEADLSRRVGARVAREAAK